MYESIDHLEPALDDDEVPMAIMQPVVLERVEYLNVPDLDAVLDVAVGVVFAI